MDNLQLFSSIDSAEDQLGIGKSSSIREEMNHQSFRHSWRLVKKRKNFFKITGQLLSSMVVRKVGAGLLKGFMKSLIVLKQ